MSGTRHASHPAPGERAPSTPNFDGWESRIYPGLQLPAVTIEVRQALASALGAVGVEAEYLLRLLESFPGAGGPSPQAGADLLARLQAFAARLITVAAELEVATQAYITAITAETVPELDRALPQGEAEPWWPPFAGWALGGESLALRLRRCGYSYRQLVALRLPDTIEAIAERMALVMHALATLPPAGTLPLAALAQGLSELADAVQGDVVPHFVRDLSRDYPGLPTAIDRLRQLAASEDTSLAGDIAWAREQYAAVASARPPASGFFARLFGRAPTRGSSGSAGTARWAEQATRDWQALIASLAALEVGERARRRSSPDRTR